VSDAGRSGARIVKKSVTAAEMKYLDRLPKAVPANTVLAHNHVRPTRRLGSRGFRAWLSPSPPPDWLAPCSCDFAPELGQHYGARLTF